MYGRLVIGSLKLHKQRLFKMGDPRLKVDYKAAGFEPGTSRVRSDHSINCATTTKTCTEGI